MFDRSQLDDVRSEVGDGNWYTLETLAALTGHPEASISARLRELRLPENGNCVVERRRITGSKQFQYRVLTGN